jgi:hypothetical protein
MPRVRVGDRQVKLPRSRLARLGIGGALIVFGVLGFLPILGFWMVPLGLLVLSIDLPVVRRLRRRAEVWILRRRAAWKAERRRVDSVQKDL